MNGVADLIERRKIGIEIGTLVLPMQEAWDRGPLQPCRYGAPGRDTSGGRSGRDKASRRRRRPYPASSRQKGMRIQPGNEASMVLALSSGEFDMLLSGDVEGKGKNC